MTPVQVTRALGDVLETVQGVATSNPGTALDGAVKLLVEVLEALPPVFPADLDPEDRAAADAAAEAVKKP